MEHNGPDYVWHNVFGDNALGNINVHRGLPVQTKGSNDGA